MTERIGIFGGSFNPVHLGHLVMAQDALERFELDRVLLVPCAHPPHKDARGLADAEHRAAMIEAAIEGDPRLSLCRTEIERGGISWTVDTLRALRADMPGADLVFIVGADMQSELHTWRRIDEIFRLCRFAVLGRPGFDPDAPDEPRGFLAEGQAADLRKAFATGHEIGISSTEIRMRVAEGLSIRYLVPDSVAMYIAEHGLYAG